MDKICLKQVGYTGLKRSTEQDMSLKFYCL